MKNIKLGAFISILIFGLSAAACNSIPGPRNKLLKPDNLAILNLECDIWNSKTPSEIFQRDLNLFYGNSNGLARNSGVFCATERFEDMQSAQKRALSCLETMPKKNFFEKDGKIILDEVKGQVTIYIENGKYFAIIDGAEFTGWCKKRTNI